MQCRLHVHTLVRWLADLRIQDRGIQEDVQANERFGISYPPVSNPLNDLLSIRWSILNLFGRFAMMLPLDQFGGNIQVHQFVANPCAE